MNTFFHLNLLEILLPSILRCTSISKQSAVFVINAKEVFDIMFAFISAKSIQVSLNTPSIQFIVEVFIMDRLAFLYICLLASILSSRHLC